ncbi:hypothetical protein LLG07_04095, partial [bacterium]|nr:hypothetical protein [bacterium]
DHYINLAKESPEDECWPFSNYFKRRISVKKISDKDVEDNAEGLLKETNEKTGGNSIGSINRSKLEDLKKAMLSDKNTNNSENFSQNSNKESRESKDEKTEDSDFEQPQLL